MVMLVDGRARILADGPLTAVASFRATAAERASAYSPQDAHRMVERLCRDARGGDRQVLVDLCQVIADQPRFDAHNISTPIFADRIREAVSRGRLLLVPGWPRMRGHRSGPPAPPRAARPPSSPAASRKASPSKEPPRTEVRKVLSIAWDQPEAWCSDRAAYRGTTEGYDAGESIEVAMEEAGGRTHKTSVNLSSTNFAGQWQVKEVLPRKAEGRFVREVELDAEAGGRRATKPLLIKFAPTASGISHTHEHHTFEVSALDYTVEVRSQIKFLPGWGASVVKLGDAVPPTTGGLLDGQFAWTGYRWMRRIGGRNRFWDGESWRRLPTKFTLRDANNFCVGFYRRGSSFACQYGGTWPDTFEPWDVDAADKVAAIKRWTDNIRNTWTGKFDLKRADCSSEARDCCRYRVKVAVSFSKQTAFADDVIIIANGNIRSNDALFFVGEPRVSMAAHEFGHHIGNPDEYRGAKVDPALNDDGARRGIDRHSIMGQKMTKVKARHFRLLANVLADAIHAEVGKTFMFKAVRP